MNGQSALDLVLPDPAVRAALGGNAARAAFLGQVFDDINTIGPTLCAGEAVQLALDVLALHGQHNAQVLRARLPMMAVRAASRLRAQAGKDGGKMGVHVAGVTQPYARFFAVEEYDLTHDRFDGAVSPALRRAVFVMGDAVTVLPYDPQRGKVLLWSVDV